MTPSRLSTGDLKMWSSLIIHEIRKSGMYDNDQIAEGNRQALCLAEEAGEVIGAYRRYTGQARRVGPKQDLENELADLILVAFGLAYLVGADPDVFIERKLKTILTRHWNEPCL